MLKKVFICFFVVLLITTLVVPSFASSGSSSGTAYYQPSVLISNVQLLDGTYKGAIADWPNNYRNSNQAGALVSFPFAGFEIFGGSADDNAHYDFTTNFYPGTASSFRLNISDLFWSENTRFVVDDDGNDHFVITSISVSGSVSSMSTSSGNYFINWKYFTQSFAVNASSADLADLVRRAVGDIYGYGDLVYLKDVQIDINFYLSDPDYDKALTFRVSGAEYGDYYAIWFTKQKLAVSTVSSSDIDYFDWLLDSVNAFLDLEIVPGLSINRLFYIVLIIGILLWFIRLLS